MNKSWIARKKAQIALIQELGASEDAFRTAAKEAVRRGMYSVNTNLGDIESAMRRTWLKWNRKKYQAQLVMGPPSLQQLLDRARIRG